MRHLYTVKIAQRFQQCTKNKQLQKQNGGKYRKLVVVLIEHLLHQQTSPNKITALIDPE